ncbi:MAG: sugar phosphate nucleotidyltransferase, partial [Planctomycetota bacterium]
MNLFAVVMAGGAGTRFWPLSRRLRPKQVLSLAGPKPLVAETLERIRGIVPPGRTWIVTGADQAGAIRRAIPAAYANRIVAEPVARDTSAAVALGAALAAREDPSGVIAVLPADHAIGPASCFRAALTRAAAFAHDRGGLLTFGIPPRNPSIQYGYIERGDAVPGASGFFRVRKFHEKPDLMRARRYVAGGRFYWNSGIFAWRADAIQEALAGRNYTVFAGHFH